MNTDMADIDTWDDAFVAALARRWLAGENQTTLGRSAGFSNNTAISLRFRRFVAKYLPVRFGYAASRKPYMAAALAAYENRVSRNTYVIRIECDTLEDRKRLFDAIESLIYQMWQRPPVTLSAAIEPDTDAAP